ncbi:MAG: alfa-L-rhamnosidase, partial [Erysipelotrichaceae bacterium]|nr:alfa-L-rhamnosidase [Erysipelotrichaceae bacterium]
GFRYMLLETETEWKADDFTAIAVYSDLERTGFFESSNVLLNRFVENTVWSFKNNHLDIPTDCPTRERHGWTGDIQVFQKTAQYLFDYVPFAKKYLHDVYDWQKEDGRLPQIAPYGGVDFFMAPMNGSVGWSDVGILMPYRLWKQYGDRDILVQHYKPMKKYAGFMMNRIGKRYLTAQNTGLPKDDAKNIVNAGQSFGEWAEPADVHQTDWLRDMSVPHPEESTAYTCYVLEKMAEIAEVLGKKDDADLFEKEAQRVRRGYQALRQLPEFTLDTNRQASLVRPLYMNRLNETQKEYAKERLLAAMEQYGWRLGTGFLSTPLILPVLEKIDLNAAYKLLENEEMPGWLFMPKSGADTIWESWEGTEAQGGIASLDHYSKGSCVEWVFESMCGIQVDSENHFVIAPHPGGTFTYGKARYQSVYGMVESGWVREEGKTRYTVTIPANCTAEIRLPHGKTEVVKAGTVILEED